MYLPTAVGQKQTSILAQCLFHCLKHALLNVLDTQCISTASSIFNATPSLCLPLLSEQSGLVLLHQFSQMVQKESGIDFLAHGQVHLLVVFVVFFSAVICVSAVTVTKKSYSTTTTKSTKPQPPYLFGNQVTAVTFSTMTV